MLTNAFKMVDQLGKVADNLTDADQRQLRAFIADYKRMAVACDVAEQIFCGRVDTAFIGDNSFDGADIKFYPKEENRAYWILREKFNKND